MTETHAELLYRRSRLTEQLIKGPLHPLQLLERAHVYQSLGYADLAAADAYIALTLAETAFDQDFSDLRPEYNVDGDVTAPWPPEDQADAPYEVKRESLKLLVNCLTELGCLRDAYGFLRQLGQFEKAEFQAKENESRHLHEAVLTRFRELNEQKEDGLTIADLDALYPTLPQTGFARREIYPWNDIEPHRTSQESIDSLNNALKTTAPDLEAKATVLPILSPPNTGTAKSQETIQLGLFAKTDLAPGTAILRERSVITAIRSPEASLCDACAAPLPELDADSPPIPCPECRLIVFCSKECLSIAQASYHGSHSTDTTNDKETDSSSSPFCNNDTGLDDIGRDPHTSTPADDLYFLLLARTIAMAETRQTHPLALFETKYLCGEFTQPISTTDIPIPVRTLPFSFHHTILLPTRLFETLMLSSPTTCTPYSAYWLRKYDFWILNTLYAKFRAVASARQSTWDGRPEVAAVHPLWSLANHSCDPNVEWESGRGEVEFKVRQERVWKREGEARDKEWNGIKAGEEILNHYCDVRLPVGERREWAHGALGGDCRCERCVWESRVDGVRSDKERAEAKRNEIEDDSLRT